MYEIEIIFREAVRNVQFNVKELTTALSVARLLLYDNAILAVDIYDEKNQKIF